MNSLGCTKQPLTAQQRDRAGRMFSTVTQNKHRTRVQILDWIRNNLFKRRAQTRLSKKKWSASLFLLRRPSKMWPVQPPQCPAWSKQCLSKHIKQNGQYHAVAAKSCEQQWLPQDYHHGTITNFWSTKMWRAVDVLHASRKHENNKVRCRSVYHNLTRQELCLPLSRGSSVSSL